MGVRGRQTNGQTVRLTDETVNDSREPYHPVWSTMTVQERWDLTYLTPTAPVTWLNNVLHGCCSSLATESDIVLWVACHFRSKRCPSRKDEASQNYRKRSRGWRCNAQSTCRKSCMHSGRNKSDPYPSIHALLTISVLFPMFTFPCQSNCKCIIDVPTKHLS